VISKFISKYLERLFVFLDKYYLDTDRHADLCPFKMEDDESSINIWLNGEKVLCIFYADNDSRMKYLPHHISEMRN